jgi:tetratricopeptide (TPR) repeat protein
MDEYEQLSAIISDGSKPPAERINARLERGLILLHTARWRDAALDFTAVMEDPHCTPEQRGNALNRRAALYTMTKESALALRDLEKIIGDPAMSPKLRGIALNNAAVAYENTGNLNRALEIYTLAIEDPGTETESRYMKRLARANLLKKIALDTNAGPDALPKAIAEYDALLADPDTPRDIKRSAEYFKRK